MSNFVSFALLGLGPGAAYALAALGIVVVFRGSGVVNFAHVGIAIVAAFTDYDVLQAGGPQALAVIAGLLAAATIGLLIHLLVMNPMRRSSTLTRVVATLGLLSIMTAAAGLRYGDGTIRLARSILPSASWHAGRVAIGQQGVWLTVLSAILCAVLYGVYRFTVFGQLTTAVAQNHRSVAALGRSPNRIALLNWVVGGALAGAAGILIAPVVGLSVEQLGLLLTPALAAALIGGLSSFATTWLGAMLLGMAQSEVTRYVSAPGWSSALPLVVIIGVLVLRGRALPERGHVQARLPAVGTGKLPMVPTVIALGILIFLIFTLDAQWVDSITVAEATALICMSLVAVTGYAGQLSLAQFALAGIAALVATRASAAWGLSFWLSAPMAIVVTTVVGAIFALPALRTRGVRLGIVTLCIAVVVEQAVLGNPAYTGGTLGTVVKSPSIDGLSLDETAHPQRYAILCLVAVIVTGLALMRLRRGRTGRRLLAIRNNEQAAASLGLNVVGLKLYAFVVGAAVAAAGGVLLAFQFPDVLFGTFTAQQSINALGLAVIGGIGYIGGALFGAFGVSGGPMGYALNFATTSPDLISLISGIGLVLVMLHAPNGAFSLQARAARVIGRRVRPAKLRQTVSAPAAVGTETRNERPRVVPTKTLRAEGLSISFGGNRALDEVSLEVHSGEVLGVIGPNGAGKTTLIDVISGLTKPNRGRVLLDGRDISGLSMARRAREGVVRSFQSLELFDDLTVFENLLVPSERHHPKSTARTSSEAKVPSATTVLAAVRHLNLDDVLDCKPGELTYGQRRMLAIARALAANPSILLLDEPAAGLDDHERDEIADLLRHLAEHRKTAVILVEHDVALVAKTCDRIVTLDIGRVIAEGDPQDVLSQGVVAQAYLGSDTELARPQAGWST